MRDPINLVNHIFPVHIKNLEYTKWKKKTQQGKKEGQQTTKLSTTYDEKSTAIQRQIS
jgi:hypothetical protein